jgi:hypothetical protein
VRNAVDSRHHGRHDRTRRGFAARPGTLVIARPPEQFLRSVATGAVPLEAPPYVQDSLGGQRAPEQFLRSVATGAVPQEAPPHVQDSLGGQRAPKVKHGQGGRRSRSQRRHALALPSIPPNVVVL